MTSYVQETPQDWDLFYKELAFAYNTSVHSSTGVSPAHLYFGRKLNVPLDIVYGSINDEEDVHSIDIFRQHIQQIYNIARENSIARQDVTTSYYDKKVCNDKIDVGTLVYIILPRNVRIKLTLKWAGPAKVVQNSHPLYKIETKTSKGNFRKWVTRNKLKRAPSDSVIADQNVNDVRESENVISSDSDSEEINDQRKTYHLRDRSKWRKYYGAFCVRTLIV